MGPLKLLTSSAVLTLCLLACTQEPDLSDKSFTDLDGVSVHYEKAGGGDKTILMVHGFGSGAFTWEEVQKRTPPEFTTIAIDLPGFGYSSKPASFDYGLPASSRTVARFIEKAVGGPVLLVGNSMGGAVTVWTSSDHPSLVVGAVLVDAAGTRLSDEKLPFALRMVATPVIGPLLMRLPSRPLVRQSLQDVYHHDARITEGWVDRYYLPSRFPGAAEAWHRTLVDLIARTDRGEVVEKMRNVRRPVLLVWGAHDPWTPTSRLGAFQSNLPQATTIIYEDLGHVPQEEDPERFAADLFSFARSVFQPPQQN